MIGRTGFLRNSDVVNINLNLCWPTWRVLLVRTMFLCLRIWQISWDFHRSEKHWKKNHRRFQSSSTVISYKWVNRVEQWLLFASCLCLGSRVNCWLLVYLFRSVDIPNLGNERLNWTEYYCFFLVKCLFLEVLRAGNCYVIPVLLFQVEIPLDRLAVLSLFQ